MAADVSSVPKIPHRIGRMLFQLRGMDEARLLSVRAEIASGVESWLSDLLSDTFDGHASQDSTVTIDRLEIDLGDLGSTGSFDRDRLRRALEHALTEQASTRQKKTPVQSPGALVPDDEVTEALGHFLKTGTLQWWSPAAHLADLFELITQLEGPALVRCVNTLRPMLRRAQPAERLARQAPQKLVLRIVSALRGALGTEDISDLYQSAGVPIANSSHDEGVAEAALAQAIRTAAGAGTVTASPYLPEDQQLKPKIVSGAGMAESLLSDDTDAALSVDIAGVVLLHPFLPMLFENLGLGDSKCFTDSVAQERAIHLTAHLATGRVEHAEPELALAKILCGLPLSTPVSRAITLTTKDVNECQDLLTQVIAHWSVLGATSPDGLREGFLQRTGRVTQTPTAWELTVDSHSIDVLLDRLPWGIGVIRLPWLDRLIMVKWS